MNTFENVIRGFDIEEYLCPSIHLFEIHIRYDDYVPSPTFQTTYTPHSKYNTPTHEETNKQPKMSILERINPLGYGVGRTTHALWRFLQFVLALTVIGLYGTDLANANKQHKYSDGKWVYLPLLLPLSPKPKKPKITN